jgi:hypothetical protein
MSDILNSNRFFKIEPSIKVVAENNKEKISQYAKTLKERKKRHGLIE